jgi:quercetin dioxygenase-like cupin family protein
MAELNATEGHTYLRDHQLSGEALLFDLKADTETVLAEARSSNAGRAARTLVKQGPLRLTIVGFKSGARLADHKAAGPVSIQVLEGALDVAVGQRSEKLDKGRMLVLDADVEHSLTAGSADAVILLGITLDS